MRLSIIIGTEMYRCKSYLEDILSSGSEKFLFIQFDLVLGMANIISIYYTSTTNWYLYFCSVHRRKKSLYEWASISPLHLS